MPNAGEKVQALKSQYEAWPYPQVPLLASLPSTHPFELHCAALWDRCGSGSPPARPRLWLAGCGTFQPYVFALANPQAEIVATDLSSASLAIARRRCRLHGLRHVEFAPVDLGCESTWPAGPFDLIECYGVLMNLPDPAATLAALGRRLTRRGVLRLMVYPQFSRARIFQIQRLARLCSLHAGDRTHPSRLRALLRALPRAQSAASRIRRLPRQPQRRRRGRRLPARRRPRLHRLPARRTDRRRRTAAGVLVPPAVGQPDLMAERLQLADRSQSFVLNYLDLWQELRSNFVVCLRAADAPPPERAAAAPHPLFAGSEGGLRHRLRLLRLQLLGGRLPSRTGDGSVRLCAASARALRRGLDGADAAMLQRLSAAGLVLGSAPAAPARPAHTPFPGEPGFLAPGLASAAGRRIRCMRTCSSASSWRSGIRSWRWPISRPRPRAGRRGPNRSSSGRSGSGSRRTRRCSASA